jgi:hypothetical protein
MVVKVIADGVLHHYVSSARLSWVDVDNVAEVAALTLAFQVHAGKQQTWL